nr:hypothetical protein [Tanacetum cinerariifolium]
MSILTMRARRFLQKTDKNLGANGLTSMGKRHSSRECRSPKDSRRPGSYDWSYQAYEEPANFALMVFSSNLSSDNKLSPTKPEQDLSHTTRPIAPIIEDWVSDSEEEYETKATQFVPSFAQSYGHVKSPRHSAQQIKTSILAAPLAPASPNTNSSGKRRNKKACFICKSYAPLTHSKPQKILVVTRPRYAHHVVTKSKSSISKYITRSSTSKTSTSPLRVTAVKASVVSAAQGKQGKWNNDKDAAFDGKEHDFDAKKPKSVVILSSSSSAQTKKQDDNTKIEDKGKSPVESFIRYRDLNAEFEDCSANSSNEVNADGSIVPTVRQNSLNNTNTFSAAGPYNTVVSPTYGKSSFIDASQLPDDSDMPELEDITYSDDEDVSGAEGDFNNLESSIPVSPIPTTRIHKDHPVS